MEGRPQSSETYLEVSSLHTVIVNAVSLCSVSRDVFFIDFFLWFRMKFMQVAIFQWKQEKLQFTSQRLDSEPLYVLGEC